MQGLWRPERGKRDWSTFWKEPRCQMLPCQPGPPCPACSGLPALYSAPKAGRAHVLIPFWTQTSPLFPHRLSQHPCIGPGLFPHKPVSELWKLLVDRREWIRFFGFYLDLKIPPVWVPQESPRVLPSYRNPSPMMEGRTKVPCRLQRDKDSRLQGVSQLPAVLISRVQSSA